MSGELPVVCIFGVKSISFKSSIHYPNFETGDFYFHCYSRGNILYSRLHRHEFSNLFRTPSGNK